MVLICSTVMSVFVSLVFVCLGGAQASHQAWNYRSLNQTGKSCPEKDSCSFARSSSVSLRQDWKSRNCFCDMNCSIYGDCCIDAEAYNPQEQKEAFEQFSCVTLKQYGDVYMKTQCPQDWQNANIRKACQATNNMKKDPFGSLPVMHLPSGITYRNYFCAICNGKNGADLHFWKPRLEYPTLNGYNQRFKNITKHFLLDNLEQSLNGQWGVRMDTNGISVFHECLIDPALPEDVSESHLRQCNKVDVIHSCPEKFLDDEISSLCSSYTAMMYTTENAYRNVHCAMCHDVDLDTVICVNLNTFGRSGFPKVAFHQTSFAILLDVNDKGSVPCQDDELWDPFLKKCRNVVCGVSGEIYSRGKCYNKLEYIQITTTAPTSSAPRETTTLFPPRISSSAVTTTFSAISKWDKPSLRTPINTENLLPHFPKNISKISVNNQKPHIRDEEESTTQYKNDTFKICPKIYLKPEEFKYSGNNIYIPSYNRTIMMGSYEFVDANTVTICAPSTLQKVECHRPIMEYVTVACLGLAILCLLLHLAASCIAPQLQNLSGKNLFSLSASLLGGYCSFLVNILAVDLQHKLMCFVVAVTMYYFFFSSFVWMLIIAFDVARTLKLASTELCLTSGGQWGKFALYSCLGWGAPTLATVLVSVIDTVHFVDIPSNFRPGFGANVENKVDSDMCKINLCWFSSRDALLVYFAIPFACIMLLNIVLFVYSACLVCEAAKNSAKITTKGPKTNFLLYLKLTILQCLTWIAGLVAAAIDAEPVWYVFLALNTLQGLFILLFFTCSKKVLRSIGEILFKSAPAEDSTWRWSSSSGIKRDYADSSIKNTNGGRSWQGYAQYHQYDQRYYQ